MTIRFLRQESTSDFSTAEYIDPPPWPDWLLQRHGGRTLQPSEAVPAVESPAHQSTGPGGVVVESTVYRADTLLIPDSLLRDPAFVEAIAEHVKIRLVLPPTLSEVLGDGDQAARLRELPRPVRLAPPDTTAPAPIDAWTVLQTIRWAVGRGSIGSAGQKADLARISLDHLLVGTRFGGVPTYDPQDPRGGGSPGGGHAVEGRHPVAALVVRPRRAPDGQAEAFTDDDGSQRRPVVAVLDTGVRHHAWFDDDLDKVAQGGGSGFLRLSVPTQAALSKHQVKLAGLSSMNVLSDYLDGPVFGRQLSDRVNPSVGHGTFIAGLIHQHAPDADVLSVRVLRPDNVGYESDVLLALWLLADQVEQAQDGAADASTMVDVISMSLGYYHETWLSEKLTRLGEVIDKLTDLGVVVVASAGNDSTTRAFLPAALAGVAPTPARQSLVLGVGAMNPNSTTSWYSNGGPSVSVEATGTCLISTFPEDIEGSTSATYHASGVGRQSVDPDSYVSGFAMWSGTSFAAPLVAAAVARALVAVGSTALDRKTTVERAVKALHELSTAFPPRNHTPGG